MVCCCLPGLVSISPSNASSSPASVALSRDLYFSANFPFIPILCDLIVLIGDSGEGKSNNLYSFTRNRVLRRIRRQDPPGNPIDRLSS
ncbi:hypothetical protein B296_00032703 [Ensete ventricosum]|uniref:Uncharacterized protein n=1 Tax=Ensete ventricosum TaxID=4639 RepID=A0A427A459_ENSVE|nr:hypothetical protein B296_00032703 [Ensete ventricosum]